MAQNKPVNKLPIVDNPSITGYTIYEDGIKTSITSIDSIRNIINENIVIPISGVTGLGVILTGLTENKLDKNPPIQSRVRTKITYDINGLVISGDILTKDDIPLLDYYSLTGGTLLNEQITGLTNSFNTHTGNTLNPHNVTATQIGVYTSGQTDTLLSGKSGTGHTHNQYLTGYTETNPGVYTSGQTDTLLSGKSGTGHTHNYLPSSGGTLTGNVSGTTFYGSGAGLNNIPSSGITGLNLSQISSDGVTASVSSSGFTVNSGGTFNGYITSSNVSGTSLNTGDERYTNLTPTQASIGGIPTGSTFNSKTITQMFDDLLYPELFPTLTNISSTFTFNLSSLYEIGSTISSITFNSLFSRGLISPAYGTSGYISGLPTLYSYSGSGLSNTVTSSLNDVKTVSNYIVLTGYQNWTNNITYLGGGQPLSNKGNNYNSPLSSGITSTITRTVEGIYPIFGTSVNISTMTSQTLVSMLTGNNVIIGLVSETGGNKQKIEIPTSWVTSRPLVGIQQLNTVSNQYEYPGGSSSASLLVWTITNVTQTIQGNSVNYKRYTYNGTDRSSVTIKLIF